MLFTTKPKILLVEDQEINHPLYKTAFEQNGFEVVICGNVEDNFIEQVATINPTIISMDLMIGSTERNIEHDGFDAISWLKNDPRTKNIPIIVLTNFFEEESVRRAKELGAVDYIVIQGQTISKIPEHYLRYLKNPKHYTPSHPLFRETSK